MSKVIIAGLMGMALALLLSVVSVALFDFDVVFETSFGTALWVPLGIAWHLIWQRRRAS